MTQAIKKRKSEATAESLRLNVLVSTRFLSDRDNKNIIDFHSEKRKGGKQKYIDSGTDGQLKKKKEGMKKRKRNTKKKIRKSLRLNVLVSTRCLSDRDNKNIIDFMK
jgi:hypothetical protein